MKFETGIDSAAKFFNDFIGALVPSCTLVFCLIIMHFGPVKLLDLGKSIEGTGMIFFIIGLFFALGHAITALHEHILRPLFYICRILKRFDEQAAKGSAPYQSFKQLTISKLDTNQQDNWSFFDIRNIALSVSLEATSLGRRFMFISLLCNGLGTSLIIIGIDFLTSTAFLPEILFPYKDSIHWIFQATLIFGLSFTLFRQGNIFYKRALTVPFAVALAELTLNKSTIDSSS